MLTELVVEGVGVIERAELGFERGSSALTGETGAGKTLVVAAVGLLLGGRADRALVRTGAKQARVEGRFLLSGENVAIRRLVAEGVIEGDDRGEVEVVVTRAVTADGSGGRARINGRLVTRALVEEIARLEQAEGLAEGLGEADRNLRAEGGAVELIAGAESTLEALAGADPELGSLDGRLESARLEVEDVAQGLKAREV